MSSPTGRLAKYAPAYHYIGHLGRQGQDDTLAHNAEMPAPLLRVDYARIELRVLIRTLYPSGWRKYVLALLPFWLRKTAVLYNLKSFQ